MKVNPPCNTAFILMIMDMKKREIAEKRPLGLYIHIPFCVKKCAYCDFLSFPSDEATKEQYVNALCEEIRANKENGEEYTVETVYFGGGTPSVLSVAQIGKIFGTVLETFSVRGFEDVTSGKKEKKEKKKLRFGKKNTEEPEQTETRKHVFGVF